MIVVGAVWTEPPIRRQPAFHALLPQPIDVIEQALPFISRPPDENQLPRIHVAR